MNSDTIRWTLTAAYAISAVATILLIGKPQKPITPGVAAARLVIVALLVWSIWSI